MTSALRTTALCMCFAIEPSCRGPAVREPASAHHERQQSAPAWDSLLAFSVGRAQLVVGDFTWSDLDRLLGRTRLIEERHGHHQNSLVCYRTAGPERAVTVIFEIHDPVGSGILVIPESKYGTRCARLSATARDVRTGNGLFIGLT